MSARAVCRCGWTSDYRTLTKANAMAPRHVCKQATGVRRTTRRYRCKRCGLQATYENAGAVESRYWFNRHSCRKQEDLMLRASQAQAKYDLVDHTPKTCLHKVATHQHGTSACYVLDLCRCTPCTTANRDDSNQRNRQKAYGRYHKYVNAEHVRAHIAELQAYGIGPKRIAELSGVPHGAISKLVYGVYAPGPAGRNGKGVLTRGPSRRVLRATAEAIYTVEAIPANLGSRVPDYERTPTARLHLRSLVALGWSMSELGRRVGANHPRNFILTITGDRPMARGTVDKAEALFDQLCMSLPPETNQRQRIAASRSRTYASEHGWRPPLALEDVLIDTAFGSAA